MKKKINLRAVGLGALVIAGIAGCQKTQTLPSNIGNLLKEQPGGTTVMYAVRSTYGLEIAVIDTAKPVKWTHIDTGAQKTLYMPPGSIHVDTGKDKSQFDIPVKHVDTGANKTTIIYPPGYTHIDTGANKTVVLPPGGLDKHVDTGANKTLWVPKDYVHIDTGANKTYFVKPPVVTTPDTVKPTTPPATGGSGTVND